jgi:hypothetical protein
MWCNSRDVHLWTVGPTVDGAPGTVVRAWSAGRVEPRDQLATLLWLDVPVEPDEDEPEPLLVVAALSPPPELSFDDDPFDDSVDDDSLDDDSFDDEDPPSPDPPARLSVR